MSVKTIFKVLIGTIAIIVASFVIIELFNVSIVSLQIRHAQDTAVRQSCELFTQETYKQLDGGTSGTINMPDIEDADGNLFVTGNFYTGSTLDDIYRNLYGPSSNFMHTINTARGDFDDLYSCYRNLALLTLRLKSSSDLSTSEVSWNSGVNVLQKNQDAIQANTFYKNYYTPANLGIPYLDEDVVEKMTAWNMTQILSECNPENIRPTAYYTSMGPDGGYYNTDDEAGVYYKGFMVYPQHAEITRVKYQVYNMSGNQYNYNPASLNLSNISASGSISSFTSPSGIITQLKNDTGLAVKTNPHSSKGIDIGLSSISASEPRLDTTINGIKVLDNAAVTTVNIEYNVPVRYIGITPLRKLFEYVWNNQVDGIGGGSGNTGNVEIYDNTGRDGLGTDNRLEDGSVPVTTGELRFWLVK